MLLAAASSSGGGNFLIPNGTIIIELIIFVLTLGLIAKFVLPPLQKVMDERETTIRSALQASDEGKAEADRLDQARLDALAAARAEARAALEQGAREAEELRAAARARGQEEFERLVSAADAELDAKANEVRRELAARLEAVVIAGAERVVGVQVNAARHRAVIDEAVAGLANAGAGAGERS